MSISYKNIFVSFLESLKVKHTKSYSSGYYNENPLRNNLMGLSKMLSEYGIENKSLYIDNKSELITLEPPFIAHLAMNEFVIVEEMMPDQIRYRIRNKDKTEPFDEFNKKWSKVVLLAEANENSAEPDYKEHIKQELSGRFEKGLLISLFCAIGILAAVSNKLYLSYGAILSFIINLAGIYIGYLLILKQLNIQSAYADRMCYLFRKSNCNNVLESKAAKFMGVIGWSEVGISYFISNAVLILFIPRLMPYLALINICTLPYSFWSVWYQKFRVKTWCPLCLAVQLLLWLLFFNNLVAGYLHFPELSISELLITGSFYLSIFLIFSLLTPVIAKNIKKKNEANEFRKIKSDPDVFKALLKKQKRYKVDRSTSKLLFGNKNAGTLITVISNPFCEGCRNAHAQMSKLLKFNGEDVCVQYIFTSFIKEVVHSSKFLISACIYDEDRAEKIFDRWFADVKGRNNLFIEYTHPIEEQPITDELDRHEAWVKKNDIHSTPTILINGYRLPANYTISDLIYLTHSLNEKTEENHHLNLEKES